MRWINYLIQFFFIRLSKNNEHRIVSYKLDSVSMNIDGTIGTSGRYKTQTYQWYSIIYWIVPLTGWSDKWYFDGRSNWRSLFVFLGKEKFIQITNKKLL